MSRWDPGEGRGQDQVKEQRGTSPHLEVWAGVEATTVRVGDDFFHQLDQSAHSTRLDDLDHFASLGIKAIRYPVLWERTAPDGPECADWRWADERLGRLRDLGVRPIVGLVHHGSGPAGTNLLDTEFPEKLARYARAVAERYPWVEDYTPVNEPLTTARFSALYGHWYPHHQEDRLAMTALLIQCRAVVLAMREIRKVNPAARLVQTEDLGKTHAVAALKYQAEFENERRWLTFDLLTGRVDRHHWMGHHLRWLGLQDAQWARFQDEPCPPDIIGINHYLTSERFLDKRLDHYPPHTHGSNERQQYADVEAVRVRAEGLAGPARLLRETWDRYHSPTAVTECHLGCTREEQLRWLKEVWDAAETLRREGADIRAVTVWSLLGAYDWDSLLTKQRNSYEPGVFDLRSPAPRPTALATMTRNLATTGTHDHPVLRGPGWWRRPERLAYRPVATGGGGTALDRDSPHGLSAAPLLIVGAGAPLGDAFARLCHERGLAYRLLTREDVDGDNSVLLDEQLNHHEPWGVIDAGVFVDGVPSLPAFEQLEIGNSCAALAAACAARGLALLVVCSDLVYAARQGGPFVETDPIAPAGAVGIVQAQREQQVLAALPDALVVRTGPLFGPWDREHPVAAALRSLESDEPCRVLDDVVVSPTYLPDLIHTALDLLIDGERGIWHLANSGAASWVEVARLAAVESGLNANLIIARRPDDAPALFQRPRRVLGSGRGQLLPAWEDAIRRYLRERDSTASEDTGPLGRLDCLNRAHVDDEDAVLDEAAS